MKENSLGSIRDLCDHHAQSTPDAVFLIDPATGESIRYQQALRTIQNVAHYLHQQGLEAGDTVAYASNNSPQTALCILGIMYGGFVATAVNLVAGNDTIRYVLSHSECKLLFCDMAAQAQLEEILTPFDFPCHCIEDLVKADNAEADPSTISLAAPKSVDAGLLMYTSGTTGKPKGVMLSHGNLVAGGRNVAIGHALTAQDSGLCVLPLYHINGLCVTLLGSLFSGSSLVLPNKFSVSQFWTILEQHACSWFSVVPTQISYLLHQSNIDNMVLPHLRFGRSASAPLAPEVQQTFEKQFGVPIIETMGLTETAAQILTNPLPPGLRKTGSPGLPVGNEMIIADENLTPMPDGEEGEILVRGDNVMMGYLRNPEATEAAITSDGWLRTGDLGSRDKDGYFTVTGRLKELIIKGGENIAPREIDEALYSNGTVIEAAAFAQDCKNYGQRVEAAVALDEGAETTAEMLRELCIRKVGAFKAPDCIYILPELPKGPSGKIQRRKLSEMFTSKGTPQTKKL